MTLISATEWKRKPLCAHTSLFLLTGFSCTTSTLAYFRGCLTSFLMDSLDPVSNSLSPSSFHTHSSLCFPATSLPLFFAVPSVQKGFVCFSSNQVLPEKHVHNLSKSKIKTKVNDKSNHIFLTAPHSEFPPGKPFQLIARGLFHLVDMHFMFLLLDMPFTPQASVFHLGSSMPSDKLPPLCEIVAAVPRESAWKHQFGRKRAGKALRLKGTCLNAFLSNSKCLQ